MGLSRGFHSALWVGGVHWEGAGVATGVGGVATWNFSASLAAQWSGGATNPSG